MDPQWCDHLQTVQFPPAPPPQAGTGDQPPGVTVTVRGILLVAAADQGAAELIVRLGGSGYPAGALPELLVAGAAQSILGALAIKAWDSARDLAGFNAQSAMKT